MTLNYDIESALLKSGPDQEIGVIPRRRADQGPEWPLNLHPASRTTPKDVVFLFLLPDMRASGVLRLGETMFSLCGALAICEMAAERKGLA